MGSEPERGELSTAKDGLQSARTKKEEIGAPPKRNRKRRVKPLATKRKQHTESEKRTRLPARRKDGGDAPGGAAEAVRKNAASKWKLKKRPLKKNKGGPRTWM